jgi:hypothetical protein
MRYAIDRKPLSYTAIEVKDEELVEYNKQYGLNVKGQERKLYISNAPGVIDESTVDNRNVGLGRDAHFLFGVNHTECDWREIIYRMALDYHKYNHLDDFALRVAASNPEDFPTGTTGYEQYYLDLEGFWR